MNSISKFIPSLLLILSCIWGQAAPVRQSLSGKVVDSMGEALPGVAIIGKNESAVTDLEGNFRIEAESGSTVIFQCLGFNDLMLEVGKDNFSNVVLTDDLQQLDETVVVGFATQKKVNLTGSVAAIDSKKMEGHPVSNAVEALQGQIPGLTITQSSGQLYGHNAAMTLRGQGTIGQGSSGSMLVLIDGMEGDIYSINPQDIENISILKDAAASSIYGSRAPFGVMLVTTKSGKDGKVSVNYNNSFRFSSPLNLPHSADSYSWALYFNEGSNNDGNGDDISATRLQRIKDYIDGKISYSTIPVEGGQWGTAYTEGNDNVDYYSVFFRNVTFSHEHNLSLNGGNKKVQYFVSANYLKQNGLLNWDNLDGLQRINVFGKVQAKPYKFMDISYSTRFIREDYHEPTTLSDDILQYFGQYLWPVSPLYDPNGILFNDLVLRFTQGGQRSISNTTSAHQFNITLEPLKGWKIVGDINYRYRSWFNKIVDKEVWQTCVDGISKGSSWDDASGVANDDGRNQYLNINAYTDFEKEINGHTFKVMGGAQLEFYGTQSTYAHKFGLILPSQPYLDTTSGMLKGENVPSVVSGGASDWRTAGFFGRINYNWKERYLIEANLRADGSSRFRRDSRWGFFPSVSLGWNIAKENWFAPVSKQVSLLKVRASYGSLGNQNTSSYYPTYELIGYANSAGTWLLNGQKANIAWPSTKISGTLTWEKIKSWNVGLDISALQNRLNITLDGFIRRTEDMIGPADELPVVFGTGVPNTNNTDLESKGFELEISWKDSIAQKFHYGIKFVLSDATTKITRYSNPSKSLNMYYAGMNLGEIWGYETVGIAKTDDEMLDYLFTLPNGGQTSLGANWQAGDVMYRDLNGDGKIDTGSFTTDDHGDLRVIGNSTPRFNYGIDLTMDWMGIDLRIFLQGVGKRDYFCGSKYFFGSNGGSKWGTMVLKEHLDYFRNNENDPLGLNMDSYYPRVYLNSNKNVQCQTRYLQNASYMRIKNVQLGYTLPKDISKKFYVENLRIFFSGENLYTFTSMTRLFDPETIGQNEQGNVYPLTRTWSFGLSLTF